MKKYPAIVVKRSVSGSFCVIEFPISAWGAEVYIDARQDRRSPKCSFIEVVINGFVKYREVAQNDEAPQRLIELAGFIMNGGTFHYKTPEYYSRDRLPALRSGVRI